MSEREIERELEREDERERALRILAPMREGPLAVAGRPDHEAALRDRVLATLREPVAEMPRQRRARLRFVRAAVAGSVALAAAAAVLLMLRSGTERVLPKPQPTATVPAQAALTVEAIASAHAGEGTDGQGAEWIDASGARHALHASGAALPSGRFEVRANGRAPRLRTAQGALVSLEPEARLLVDSSHANDGPILRVLDGEVACEVPKLGATRQFAIDAPGARVIVHGTRFTVRAQGGRTCVRVTEGHVAVHPDAGDAPVARLGPGERWGCDDEAQSAAALATQPEPQRARAVHRRHAKLATGTLDAENRLLTEALGAERALERESAHRLFEKLLRRYPGSPLAVEARAGLARTQAP